MLWSCLFAVSFPPVPWLFFVSGIAFEFALIVAWFLASSSLLSEGATVSFCFSVPVLWLPLYALCDFFFDVLTVIILELRPSLGSVTSLISALLFKSCLLTLGLRYGLLMVCGEIGSSLDGSVPAVSVTILSRLLVTAKDFRGLVCFCSCLERLSRFRTCLLAALGD